MNSLHKLAVATLIVAAPSLSFAQGKAPHPTPPPAERITDKIERSELNFAHDQKLLTKGIRSTSAEKKQMKAIEKKYDADYRDLLQKAKAADRAARKNGTASGSHAGLKTLPQPLSDATFQSQLSQLQTQERTDMRAVLTPQQQSIFDSNVTKLSTRK
jgi:Spy/CpxP family protein refolding chaperone